MSNVSQLFPEVFREFSTGLTRECTIPIHSVPILTIPAIRSLRPYFHAEPLDRPWHALMPAIWLQLVQSASLLCTCIPTLKRVLADLQTGMMAGAVSDFFEMSVSGGHNNSNNDAGEGSGSGSASKSRGSTSLLGQRIVTGSTRAFPGGLHRGRPRVDPMESQTRLRENLLVQSYNYEVGFDGHEPRASSTSHDLESIMDDGVGSAVHHLR